MRIATAFVIAAGVGAASASAQSQPAQQPNQPRVEQSQRDTQDRPNEPRPLRNVVSVAGCVVQTSDQPTVFAIRQMGDESDAKGSPGQRGSTSAQSTPSSKGSNQTGQTARSGEQASDDNGSSTVAQSAEGAWYRLAPSGGEDLKRHVGQRVRINGQLIPGRDPQGNEVVIHRFTPDKTVVTTIDLQPAPQLSISSITPLGGSCETTGEHK